MDLDEYQRLTRASDPTWPAPSIYWNRLSRAIQGPSPTAFDCADALWCVVRLLDQAGLTDDFFDAWYDEWVGLFGPIHCDISELLDDARQYVDQRDPVGVLVCLHQYAEHCGISLDHVADLSYKKLTCTNG